MNLISAISPAAGLRLGIVGYSARAAAALAVRAGHTIVAIDAFGDLDLRALGEVTVLRHFPRGAARALRAARVDGWLYTGGLENHPRLVDELAKIAPLFGNPGGVLRKVRDPVRVCEVLRKAGLPAAEVRLGPENLDDSKRWLVKPLRSGGGRGIEFWRPESPVRRGVYYQEFIDGPSHGALFVGNGQEAVLLGIAEHLPSTQGFLYRGSIFPSRLDPPVTQDVVWEVGDRLTREFGLVGLFGVDFVLAPKKKGESWSVPLLIEVNPRWTASVELYERAGLASMIGIHLTACIDGRLPTVRSVPTPNWMFQRDWMKSPLPIDELGERCFGKEILYATRSLKVPEAFVTAALRDTTASAFPLIADISPAGTDIPQGAPIVTIFASGEAPADVSAKLAQSAQQVQARLAEKSTPGQSPLLGLRFEG